MKYRYLAHTADVKLQAYGKSLEEAFGNAALALFNVIIDEEKVKGKITKEITVNGKDLKSLLYNFLEEFLFLLDTEGFVLGKIKKAKIKMNKEDKKYELNATVVGDSVSNYETKGSIKAVTYNDMEIIEEKNKVTVQVVLDA